MKTPEEIKKGLESCNSDECHGNHTDCPYVESDMCMSLITGDALAYIQQLEDELAAVKRERDALMEDFDKYRIRNIQQTSGVYACDLCKYGGDPYRDDVGKKCPKGCDGMTKWKWRGMCVENGGIIDD